MGIATAIIARNAAEISAATGIALNFELGDDPISPVRDTAGECALPAVSVPLPPAAPDHFAGPDDLDDVCAALEAASEISLDLETTHLTPWSKPLPAGKTVRIGDGTINQYLSQHQCTLDNTPRARILAVETDSGLIAAIDLDQLTPEQKTRVIKAAARPDVTWVGHNLSPASTSHAAEKVATKSC